MKKMFHTIDRRKFKTTRFIVVSNEMIPMFFDGEQLVYASSRKTAKAPAEIYTVKQAKAIIKKSKAYRKQYGYVSCEYFTIPVY